MGRNAFRRRQPPDGSAGESQRGALQKIQELARAKHSNAFARPARKMRRVARNENGVRLKRHLKEREVGFVRKGCSKGRRVDVNRTVTRKLKKIVLYAERNAKLWSVKDSGVFRQYTAINTELKVFGKHSVNDPRANAMHG